MQCPKCNYEYLTEELEEHKDTKNKIVVYIWCKNCGASYRKTLDIRSDFKKLK